ncbi:MAG TPA: hypothetical protein VK932_07420 [Kofleriaceae bacterium]|nr:hypothetical protein [Kofleriaceae bacterium]
MSFFVRAVVQGFALSLGSALFKKVQDRIGLGENKDKKPSEPEAVREAASDPDQQS